MFCKRTNRRFPTKGTGVLFFIPLFLAGVLFSGFLCDAALMGNTGGMSAGSAAKAAFVRTAGLTRAYAAQTADGAREDTVVVCIDAGHGGENLGAEWNGFTEKELTLAVALAMRDRLQKYDGVEVYMTRTDDADMTLEERVSYAASVGADFLFSLHFNASENKQLYGDEVWASAFGEYYVKGRQFGLLETEALSALGLVNRGVKTKVNDKGTDYYGIMRHGVEYGVPAVIVEHCHIDNERDEGFYETREKCVMLGELDADCAAEYFGLSSASLGVSFAGRKLADVPVPKNPVMQDTTPPDVCLATLLSEDTENGVVEVEISGADYDAEKGVLYYSYSFDGGITDSPREVFPQGRDTIQVRLTVPKNVVPTLVIKVYNAYDLDTASEPIGLSSVKGRAENDAFAAVAGTEETAEGESAPKEKVTELPGSLLREKEFLRSAREAEGDTFFYFLEVCAIVVLLLFFLFLLTLLAVGGRRGRRRRRQRKRARRRRTDTPTEEDA